MKKTVLMLKVLLLAFQSIKLIFGEGVGITLMI